ncbi:MAG TPA: hypothetical protein VJ723_00770, partial [Candidatus Angelobacter sp.]|nr:hypothetical protein [Candidatus Angelobacter sp.]
KAGIWITGSLGFLITLGAIALATFPPGGVESKAIFRGKLALCTAIFIGFGLVLYFWRRMSVFIKSFVFAVLGFSVALFWFWLRLIAAPAYADSLAWRIVLNTLLVTCPGFLLGIMPLLACLLNAVLYGGFSYWLLDRKNRA